MVHVIARNSLKLPIFSRTKVPPRTPPTQYEVPVDGVPVYDEFIVQDNENLDDGIGGDNNEVGFGAGHLQIVDDVDPMEIHSENIELV